MIRQLQPEVIPKTASFALDINAIVSGSIITNRGALGPVVVTLPTLLNIRAHRGYTLYLVGVANFNLGFANAVGKGFSLNLGATNGYTLQNAGQLIGGRIEAFWDGTQWSYSAINGVGTPG